MGLQKDLNLSVDQYYNALLVFCKFRTVYLNEDKLFG